MRRMLILCVAILAGSVSLQAWAQSNTFRIVGTWRCDKVVVHTQDEGYAEGSLIMFVDRHKGHSFEAGFKAEGSDASSAFRRASGMISEDGKRLYLVNKDTIFCGDVVDKDTIALYALKKGSYAKAAYALLTRSGG